MRERIVLNGVLKELYGCVFCKEDKPFEEFSVSANSDLWICNACHKETYGEYGWGNSVN